MNWRDRLVLVGLTGILVIVGLSLGLPEAAAPVGRPSMVPVTDPPDRPYVEGVVGPLDQVSPLSARSQAERNAVALVFSGLVRLGPDETLVPDLAESWSVNDTGNQWTFRLRADATWHDGEAVTADDVAFTVNVLKNESYTGPGAASWGEVSATVVDRLTVRFDLVTPLGGFLQAATQPIVPRHVLAGIPAAFLSAPTSTFGREPVGSGPFRLTSLAAQRAEFAPAVRSAPGQTPVPGPGSSPSAPVDALRTAAPAVVPPRPTALLSGIEFRVFDSPDDLALAWQGGQLDGATGLAQTVEADLVAIPDSRLIRYPGSTLMAVVLDLRRTHPEFRDPIVRQALLAAIDRAALIAGPLGGYGVRADAPIPPSSWAFDAAASVAVAHDRAAAAAGLQKAGWTRGDDGWRRPGSTSPVEFELLSAEVEANPMAHALAAAVAAEWRALGLRVSHVALPPSELTSTRLRQAEFDAVLLSMNVGLDPDLYPLLASTQTTTVGSNLSGLQDAALDRLLIAARGPGTLEQRKAAYSALQVQLAAGTYLLPLAFRDVVFAASDRLTGPSARTLADPADRFWDVLTWRLAVDR